MAIVKCDTMINLMPDHMWLTTMPEDFDEDDIDEYGRLVIDIPDATDGKSTKIQTPKENIRFTEFRDNKPTVKTEKEMSNSTYFKSELNDKSHKLLPSRIYRDIPIKLLLKRTFQNSQNKPHKKRFTMYKAEEGQNQLKEDDNTELLLSNECKLHSLGEHEMTEAITIADVNNQRVSPQIERRSKNVSSEKDNAQHIFEKHEKEMVSTNDKQISYQVDNNIHQRVSPHSYVNHLAQESENAFNHSINFQKQNLLCISKYSTREEKQNRTRIVVDNIVHKTSQHHMKKMVSSVTLEKQNTLNVSVNHKKREYYHKLHSNQIEKQKRPHIIIDNIDLTVTPQEYNNMMKLNPDKQTMVKQATENHMELISTRIYHSNGVDQARTVISHSDRINRESNSKNNLRAQFKSSQICRTPNQNQKQRISVVSNDFLFQDHIKQDTLRRPTWENNQIRKKYERRRPQKYQEALIDFMERHYQFAVKENISVMVNSKPLHQAQHKENPDTEFTEVIHVGQKTGQQDISINNSSQQNSAGFSNPNTSKHSKKKTCSSPTESGYNILVHRGPDINRIVITIANEEEEINKPSNENEDINKTTNCKSPFGDQRVPESFINNIPHSGPSFVSQKKRSYYYKEPSLRSFRKQLSNQRIQKQIRNTVQNSRYNSSSHLENYNNLAYTQHYSYIGNHYELPTPVIDNYYTFESLPLPPNYVSSDTAVPHPWERYERRPVISEEYSKIITKVPRSQSLKSYHQDEEQLIFSPLNLSLKPHERPYSKCYPRYPIPVHDYN